MGEYDDVTAAEAASDVPRDPTDNKSTSMVVQDEPAGERTGARPVVLLMAIACTVFGARLVVISAFGSSVPVLDQWGAEGRMLYLPYLKGTLSVADLFASHNGHRIVITRLLALGHLELAGEWNTRLEMVLGALVLTVFVTWLAALLMPVVAQDRQLLLACFIALVFAFPIDYENTVWGFQSQVYLSLLAGLAALVAFASAKSFSPRWFGGLAAGILAYFTFATGVAALSAAVMLVSLQLATNTRKRCRREIAAVVVVAAIALALIVWGAGSTKTMSSLWTFAAGLGIFAALTLLGAIPILWFCRLTLMRRPSVSDRDWLMVGLSAWVAIQLALFAYGRGILVAPRYMGVVLLVYPIALVAVLVRSERNRSTMRERSQVRLFTWVLTVVGVVAVAGCASVIACSYWAKGADQQRADVRAYLVTGDVADLREQGARNFGTVLVLPDAEGLALILQNPDLRAILPHDIRPAGADIAGARNRMLLKGKLAGATDAAVELLLASSPLILAIGIGLLFVVGISRSRPANKRFH